MNISPFIRLPGDITDKKSQVTEVEKQPNMFHETTSHCETDLGKQIESSNMISR